MKRVLGTAPAALASHPAMDATAGAAIEATPSAAHAQRRFKLSIPSYIGLYKLI